MIGKYLSAFAGTARGQIVAATAAALCFTTSSVPLGAQSIRTWDGEANFVWSFAENWEGDVAPVAGDALVFSGTNNLATLNDYVAGTLFTGLSFDSSAGTFDHIGNDISLAGDIINDSASAQTIHLNMLLLQDTEISANTGTINMTGVLSGAFGLTKTGTGNLTFSSAQAFTGPVNIQGGTLQLTDTASIDTAGAISIGGYEGAAVRAKLNSQGVGGETRTFNGVNLTVGSTEIQTARPSGAGAFVTEVGAINRQVGATFFADVGSGSTLNTTSTNTNGILGGWAMNTSKTAFLTVNESGNIVSYDGYTVLSGLSQTIASDATTNVELGAVTVDMTGAQAEVGSTTLTVGNTSALTAGMILYSVEGVPAGTTIVSVDSETQVTLSQAATANATANSQESLAYEPVNEIVTLAAPGVTDINTLRVAPRYYLDRTVDIGTGNTLRLGQYGAIVRTGRSTGFFTAYEGSLSITGGTLTAGGADNTAGEIVFVSNGNTDQFSGGQASRNNLGIIVDSTIADNGTGAVTVITESDQTTQFNAVNTYSGGTFVNRGRLWSTVYGGIGTGDVHVQADGGLQRNGSQLQLTGAGTYDNNFFIAGRGYSGGQTAALFLDDDVNVSGDITVMGDTTIMADGTSILSGVITSNGFETGFKGFNADDGGDNLFILTNANSEFTRVWIEGGAGQYADNNETRLAAGVEGLYLGDLHLTEGTRRDTSRTYLELAGFDVTINGLTSTRGGGTDSNSDNRIRNASATNATLTMGQGDTPYANYGGVIEDGSGGGTTSVVKTGTGTQEFSFVTLYTGTTTVDGGVLVVSGEERNSSGIIVNNGGTYAYANAAATPIALNRAVTVNAGGTFRYSSAANFDGTITFNEGARLAGNNWNGNLDGLTISAGRVIAPGSSPGETSAGSQIWGDGGILEFEINSALGTAGNETAGWDHITYSDELDISTLTSGGFVIDLISLNQSNNAGAVFDFDLMADYSWEFASFASLNGVVSSSLFTVDSTDFANPTNGIFSVTQSGNALFLNYTAIPQPSSAALACVGLLFVCLRRRRK